MKNIKRILFIASSALVLGFLAFLVVQKEIQLASGQPVFMKLGKYDPRSLMQGDYMNLGYELSGIINAMNKDNRHKLPRRGKVVIALDENGVAVYKRMYAGGALKENEIQLKYRIRRWGRILLGPPSFLFQEGTADQYAKAEYGLLMVDKSGTALLTGLYDENFRLLGPARPEK